MCNSRLRKQKKIWEDFRQNMYTEISNRSEQKDKLHVHVQILNKVYTEI